MIHFNENKLRITFLKEFISLFKQYQETGDDDLRNKISSKLGTLSLYTIEAGIPTYTNHPIRGHVDIYANIFATDLVSPQKVIDRIYGAIGNYELSHREWTRDIINPFYWLGQFVRLPFQIMAFAGFDPSKIEASWFGKSFKAFLSFVIFTAALLQIFNLLGFDTTFFQGSDDKNKQYSQSK